MNKDQLIQKVVGYSFQAVFTFSIIATVLYYFTMYNDGSKYKGEIEKLTSDVKAETTKKKDTEATLKEESSLKTRVKELGEQYNLLSKKIPSTLNSAEVNKIINDAIKSCGAKLKTFHPESVVRKGILDEIPVTIAVEGTFTELAQFIYYISTSERIMSLKEFNLTPVNDSNKVQFEGVVTGYKLSDVEKSPTSKGPGEK